MAYVLNPVGNKIPGFPELASGKGEGRETWQQSEAEAMVGQTLL